ncbi:hypothetical protein EWB00_005417 [Schistosoma japonicum]|uniref:Uncharacterized protein n=2 Tax=Schistosoma japonicum TaxID=6182 RepID=A0A4Z2D1V3_SCHJA|nr:hypothetical protein EWB00_005417 [Schistosoma japonicum]
MTCFVIINIIKPLLLYFNKLFHILLLIELYITLLKCLPIQEKSTLSNQSLLPKISHTTNDFNHHIIKSASGLTDLWNDNPTPLIGRVIWCVNESKQKWLRVGKPRTSNDNNNNITNTKLILLNSGKFYCPQPNQTEDMKYCCGPLGKQTCCRITDTPGLRWGIPLGVIVSIIVFLTVSYTIQVFRACDRCYHECPIFTPTPSDAEFQWDTRWYTVSHEGNRYGVTFHSRLFANEFMKCLEAEYGRWNTANILKIQRDGQNFVILNIFFHDLFTPWFYTQGPIKNDEEWIRTDFKNICHTVQARLAVNPRFKWKLNKCFKHSTNKTSKQTNHSLINLNSPELINSHLDNKNTSHHLTNSNTVTTPWIPWTKVAYIPSLTETSVKKHLTRNTNKIKNKTKNDNKTNQLVNVIILEDIIECNGLDKGVQTQQKRLQTHKTEIDTVV